MNSNPEENFQTPPIVCDYMVSMLPSDRLGTVLEPTPGKGNLVEAIKKKDCLVVAPTNFYDLDPKSRYDWIVMNPPFTPMVEGYKILFACMEMSNNIIALMPWLVLINGEKRTKLITDFGLVSITHLPRKTFHSRVQTCVLEMRKGFGGNTTFTTFNW